MILFEFGIVSSSLAFPFICPFVSLILDKLMEILNVPNHIFLLGSIIYLSQIFSLILYQISKCLVKKDISTFKSNFIVSKSS